METKVKPEAEGLVEFIDRNSDEGCPVKRAADILEGKWTTKLVRELMGGTRRYSQLQRGLPGISPKILTDRLVMLEANGLVKKTSYPCIPPRTEYELTPLGREMEQVIAAMARFGISLAAESAATDRSIEDDQPLGAEKEGRRDPRHVR